jgi:hypothetical protein
VDINAWQAMPVKGNNNEPVRRRPCSRRQGREHGKEEKMRKVSQGRWSLIVLGLAAVLGVLAVAHAASPGTPSVEAPFLAENRAAMDKMMAGMDITPSGDVDHDFAAMMIPHHQGAIDMAQAELRHGHNEQLRRIAQQIIVEQQQEIVAMRLALGQPLPPSVAAPDQPSDLSAGTSRPTPVPMMNMRKER